MENLYQKYKDRGLLMWYIYTEGPLPGQTKVEDSFCQQAIQDHSFTFPVYRDPGAVVLGKLMVANGHSNLVITRKDMKIVYKDKGHDVPGIEAALTPHLRP
jgi:hypothetical protein